MNCPVCTTTELAIADRLRVEIDYCPKCRGVWLDRGELDKIIERSLQELPRQGPAEERPERHGDDHDRYERDRHDHDDDHDDDHHRDYRGGHRRKSFLKDLFDF